MEGEYITGCAVFQNASDTVTLKPFLERVYKMTLMMYENIIADPGYESEENYAYLEEHTMTPYIKPTIYEKSKTKKFKNDISKRENMKYDAGHDEYICANNKRLKVIKTEKDVTRNGYERELTFYQCENCEGCPLRERCTKSKENRVLKVSKAMIEKRAVSLANIESGQGKLLRVNRSIQVEGAFGVEKEDCRFRRFYTRKIEGVETELFLLAFAYNINKLHNKIQNDRLKTYLHPLKKAA